ncbi:MAG: NosD domain-containing protein [Nitrososphaerota archaeon]
MKHLKVVIGILICILIIEFVPICLQVQASKTIYVPDNFPTIQDAINNAIPGTTIIVRDGTYRENIIIEEKNDLVIKSEHGPKYTIICNTKEISEENIIEIIACKNIVFQGFTLINDKDSIAYGMEIMSNNVHIKSNIIKGPNINIAIILDNCHGIKIENNTLRETFHGIRMDRSDYCTISDNLIIGMDWHGIHLRHNNHDITISHNIISSCLKDGINLESGSYVEIFLNSITGCQVGIRVDSPGNSIYLNNFVANDQHIAIEKANTIWNSEPLDYIYDKKKHHGCLGNFWDDYKGSDQNHDGVGDIPYKISEEQIDRYPLMELIKFYTIITAIETTITTSIVSPTQTTTSLTLTTLTTYTSPSYTAITTSEISTSSIGMIILIIIIIIILIAIVLLLIFLKRIKKEKRSNNT